MHQLTITQRIEQKHEVSRVTFSVDLQDLFQFKDFTSDTTNRSVEPKHENFGDHSVVTEGL